MKSLPFFIAAACLVLIQSCKDSGPAGPTIGGTTFNGVYSAGNTETFWSVIQSSDSGYVLAGGTKDYPWILKVDAQGNRKWEHTYTDYSVADFRCVAQASDGGFVLTGTCHIRDSSGGNIFLLKYDNGGQAMWTKVFRGYQLDDMGCFVRQTTDGGFIIAGGSGDLGKQRGVLIKTNNAGNPQWTKYYTGDGSFNAFNAQQTPDGGYILTGMSVMTGKMILIKTDAEGNQSWLKTFGGSGIMAYGNSVQCASDGGYIVAGSFSHNAWVMKTDAAGGEQWSKSFSFPPANSSVANTVVESRDGGYLLVGSMTDYPADAFMIKLTNTGSQEWSRTYGGKSADYANWGGQANDGGFFFAGSTTSFGDGTYDAWLVKTDENGNVGGDWRR
jgi:hypothetical protein